MQEQEKKCWNSKFSRIKLAVYDTNNNYYAFYSFPREERKHDDDYIIDKIKKRILAKHFNNQFKIALVLDNRTDTLIETVEPEQPGVITARIKLVVYDTLNRRIERLSNHYEDLKPVQFAVGSMSARVLQLELRGRYNAAIFYDTQTDNEISRAEPYNKAWKKKKGVTPYPPEHSQKVPHTFAMP